MMQHLTLGSLFTGQLVRLAAKRPDDQALMARWSHDPEYMRLLNFAPAQPRSPESFEDKKNEHHDDNEFFFVFHTLADDKTIGVGGVDMSWNNQAAWVWIGIGDPDYRGKGYGSDAMRLLVGYAFRELGAYRVGLGVFGYNTRAIRAYEKIGFVHEGIQRQGLYRDGQRCDLLCMGLLRPEWEATLDSAAQMATQNTSEADTEQRSEPQPESQPEAAV
jgi:RimJ/RimL family protein N-acetyltransferase